MFLTYSRYLHSDDLARIVLDILMQVFCRILNSFLGVVLIQLSAHIMFEGCVFACLGYLEAMPWAEDEEAKVTALLGQLQLESVGVAADVMKRCSGLDSSNSEAVLVRLLHAVTKGKHFVLTRGLEILMELRVFYRIMCIDMRLACAGFVVLTICCVCVNCNPKALMTKPDER